MDDPTKHTKLPNKSVGPNPPPSFFNARSITVIIIFALIGCYLLVKSFAVTPKAASCVYTAPVAANKWGAMNYVNYTFNTPDISSITADVNLLNSPSTDSAFYIQVYDGDIGAGQQYFGIQTNGTIIWSRFKTLDKSNIRTAGSSISLNSSSEGDFISLRRVYPSLPSGTYKVRITRAEFDGVGDWFKYYVTFPGKGEDHIGDMRFPRETVGVPAAFHNGGGQWNEFWKNNGATLYPVPLLQANIKMTANNGLIASSATGLYSSMPNSDMYALAPGGYVHHELGGTTPRCHFGDSTNRIKLWENVAPENGSVPVINVTSSATSATAPASVTFTATASDPEGIKSVSFYNNGVLLGQDTTAPYTYQATNLPAATYKIVASATDNNVTYPSTGLSGLLTVTVTNPVTANKPPTVAVSASGINLTAPPATITTTASASDSDGSVAKVAFYKNGTLVSTDTAAPFTATMTNLAAGTYNLTAVATDNKGATTTSSNVAVIVKSQPPVVGDTSPPTAPTNMQVRAYLSGFSYKMLFSWNASKDNSGIVNYMVSWNGSIPSKISQTSYTLKVNVGARYTVSTYAVDPTGNRSAALTRTAQASCFLNFCTVK